ncbi:bifunctional sugar-1-phosphate nucleotidylyltransferase/acetyltransferase [Haloplanus aerogenes]|uniref:Bifunctional protein GlmU n=1 Tax=Haloplanus aerogenes TaxID=660522 RepID=A0A3M0D921_9EURY|nr:bifunctional sugar-1-phosphate nucleotidylyltransferase/acetyltransferase [Haloplanus aerogenes]AZH26301.1 glucose-1-phosphate thymidylyltransferase [Haloplanus aerogenes]RMB18241.1 bifunctional UDP-N-acetylglucosamine pyrophosphorylase/glucosamine-1-phosphate N-acetyltransferase [Haloplanus aerogenes]
MQTVVLAAGEGTRMRPLTDRRPKPTLPVADRTLVEHVVDGAVDAGANRVVVVVGYAADAVRDALGDRDVAFAVQERQRGTADAVRAARDELDDAPFAVLNGDVLYDRDSLSRLYDAGPAVGAYRVDDPENYGVLELEDDRVRGVIEKPANPTSNLVNAGAYVFPAVARDWLDVAESDRGEYELTDVLTRACETGEVRAVPVDRWLDVGRPWELLAANEWKLGDLERRIAGDVHPDADLRGAVVVEDGATVDAGVVIEGPALVRSGASVGPNAYVRGATLIGAGAKVGHAVEIKNSVLMAGATVGHLSYVGDSVLGRDVNFGAGTTVANLRHDDGDVIVRVKGDPTSTGRRKFGVVCGDDAKTGIDTALNAGVVLGTEARTTPGETVTRDRGRSP